LHGLSGHKKHDPTYTDTEISTAKAAQAEMVFFASGIVSHIHQKRSKKIPLGRQRALASDDLRVNKYEL
jgi:hypothetical protein